MARRCQSAYRHHCAACGAARFENCRLLEVMMADTWTPRRGDFVTVSIPGRSLRAMVGIASPNGRSIVLLFDGMLGPWLGACAAAHEDGEEWTALNGMSLRITQTAGNEVD